MLLCTNNRRVNISSRAECPQLHTNTCKLTQTSEELAKQQEMRGSSKTPASRSRCCSSTTRRRHKPRRTTLSMTPVNRERVENREWPLDEVPAEEEEAREATFPMERMPPAKQTTESPGSSTCARPNATRLSQRVTTHHSDANDIEQAKRA